MVCCFTQWGLAAEFGFSFTKVGLARDIEVDVPDGVVGKISLEELFLQGDAHILFHRDGWAGYPVDGKPLSESAHGR